MLEKGQFDVESIKDHDQEIIALDDDGAVPGETFTHGNSLRAKLMRTAGRYKIELRGIERVPANERTDQNLYKVGTMVGWHPFVITLLA